MDGERRAAATAHVLGVAKRQSGVVLAAQLRECGLSRSARDRLIRDGWLTTAWPGAFAVDPGRAGPTWWQQAVAVGLLAGSGAALSHSTAARAHRIPHIADSPRMELSVAPARHPRVREAIVHRVGTLDPMDIATVRGIAVTSPARTLVDLAARVPSGLLAKVIDEGTISGLWTCEGLASVADRLGPRPGSVELRRLLDERSAAPRFDSGLESRAAKALRSLGPFEVHYQVIVDGEVFILDIAWPELRVAAECDGWAVRSRSRTKFDHDRRRGNLLAAHGWAIAHLTSAMSDDEMRSAVVRLLFRSVAAR